jgi:inner membrane protein
MDTATHFAMGFALGGIATLDPAMSQDAVATNAVIIATVLGSQAPDTDTILKFKSNAIYLRNHRGATHSIPAVLLWPILISSIIHFFVPSVDGIHLWLWTFLAVFLHVFVDIFNAYGTQALRPFSQKWIALGVINTMDPFILAAHGVGFVLWIYGEHPGYTFIYIYIVIIGYYLWRIKAKHDVIKLACKLIPGGKVIISPTFNWYKWHLVIKTDTKLYVAKAYNGDIHILDEYDYVPIPENEIIKSAKKDKNISAFLSFSPIHRWEINEFEDYIEVRFIDLRYRSKGHYPFVAVVHLDDDLNVLSSFTGWIFSEKKLEKKMTAAIRE